ncbi:hypothetical protein M3Y99_01205900 [Aphelenchoides fujianensis]|nr:hypothetical protein M3Y99_01205900 [Aphelenchoides fujianensis]
MATFTDQEEAAMVKELQIPPKAPNTLRIRPLRTEAVDTNCFRVSFTETDVHRYEAKFFSDAGGPKGPKNIAEGWKNDASTERRRLLLNDLFRQLITSRQEIFGTDLLKLLFDCGQTIIAADRLALPQEVTKIQLNAELIDPQYRDYLPRKLADLYVELKFVETIHVDSARVAMDELDDDRSSLAIMEMVFNQKIVSSDKFHVFKQQCYLKEPPAGGRHREIQARLIKEGLAKGVRLCGEDRAAPQLMLQASVKTGAFYPSLPLKEYLQRLLGCRDSRDLEDRFADRRTRAAVQKDVRKLMLCTTHLRTNRMFVCDGLSDQEVRAISFDRDGGEAGDGGAPKRQKCGVVEYFEQRYGVDVRCKRLPAVVQKVRERDGSKAVNYYPLDVLKVMDGQRLPLQKMDGKFQEEMIKVARMDPPTMKQTTARLATAAFLTAANPHARRFGLGLESAAIRTNAELLHPPAIQFAQGVAEEPGHDGRLAWRPPQHRRFLQAGEARKWALVNYFGCVNERMLGDFIRRFVEQLDRRGTRISREPLVRVESHPDRVKQVAVDARVDFLLVITKDKMDPIHDVLKHFEIGSKVVTQHLWANTVFNIVTKNQMVTLENVIMKTNEKLGGTNFTLKTANKFAQDNRGVHPNIGRILEDQWLAGRLFIGIDLSHGAPGARGGEQLTVVGYSYNYNEKLSLTGGYSFQEPRQTIVQGLERTVGRAMLDYKQRSERKAWPSHVVLYRAGVSDGEFRHVTAVEKSGVKRAVAALQQSNADFRPPGFTMLICQRQTMRVFPAGAPTPGPNGRLSDADKNVRPGTLLAKDVVSPNMEQFVLVPHRGIIGTARPTVYSVVVDEAPGGRRLERAELTNLTFALCHLHGGVLGSISSPAMLYHAGALSKRGRNNYKMDQFGTVDDAATVSSGHSGRPRAEQPPGFHEELSRRLKPSLPHKFWC